MTDHDGLLIAYSAWEAASNAYYAKAVLTAIDLNLNRELMSREWEHLTRLHSQFVQATKALLDADT